MPFIETYDRREMFGVDTELHRRTSMSSKAVTDTASANRMRSVPVWLKQSTLYWVPTLYLVVTSLIAGTTEIVHAPPLYSETLRLGYPPHFSTLLGVWKVLGAVALLVPGYRLIKEWAYAGFFIDFSAAIVAYTAVGDPIASSVGPVVSMGALIASWYLRPQSRRLPETYVRARAHAV
jgi:hypothetical protein